MSETTKILDRSTYVQDPQGVLSEINPAVVMYFRDEDDLGHQVDEVLAEDPEEIIVLLDSYRALLVKATEMINARRDANTLQLVHSDQSPQQ